MTHEHPHVLISGGGPSGLLAAILLDNIGISSTVLERAEKPNEWSSKSYTVVLGDRGKSSLERAGCLASVQAVGMERNYICFFDGRTGEMKMIPKQPSGIGLTRPLLVECLEKIALQCPRVTVMRGAGVSSISRDDNNSLRAVLEDGTVVSATHVIGADGKWSQVRKSMPSLSSQTRMVASPSFGVHMNSPTVPKGFKTDGTYIINPPKECMFYIIASPRPSGGMSISIVCYDETLERYPWLAPPADKNPDDYGKDGWEDEFSALPGTVSTQGELSQRLEDMFREEIPVFYETLDREIFLSARVNRRTTWLKTSAEGGNHISYSTQDGLVTLIGDAAHAMTPSIGEGCNTALESAMKLVDSISSVMKRKGESSCSVETLSEGFIQYGLSRPKEVIPIVEASAARNILKKEVKDSGPSPKVAFLHPTTTIMSSSK